MTESFKTRAGKKPGCVDAGEWDPFSTSKSDSGIPPLGSNAYSCPCSNCMAILGETLHWTGIQKEDINFDIKIGDRVLVNGNLPGVVRYVGDLDADYTNEQIYVGIKLDDPVGEHDGMRGNKRFFKCPNMHGVIVPIEQVHILVPHDGRSLVQHSETASNYFSMPELGGDMIGSGEFEPSTVVEIPSGTQKNTVPADATNLESGGRTKVEAFTQPASSSTSQSSEVKPESIIQFSSSKSNSVNVEAKKSAVSKKLTTTVGSKMDVECSTGKSGTFFRSGSVAKAKSTGDTSYEQRASKKSITIKQQSKSHGSLKGNISLKQKPPLRGNSSLKGNSSTFKKAKSAFATNGKVAGGTTLKPAHSEGTRPLTTRSKSDFSELGGVARVVRSQASINFNAAMSSDASKAEVLKDCSGGSIEFLAAGEPKVAWGEQTCSVGTPQSSVSVVSPGERDTGGKKYEQKGEKTLPGCSSSTASVQGKTGAVSNPHRPATVPKLFLPSNPTTVNESTETTEAHLQPQPSYTGCLFSSLPLAEIVTPLSATSQLKDLQEFGDWVTVWGGGIRGWTMAQTLQKLKDAQRKGQKEVRWQRTIDELDKDDNFAPQIQRIRALRMEIARVRGQREMTEKQLKEKTFSGSEVQRSVEKLQEEVKAAVKRSEETIHKIRTHPLAALVMEAKKLLLGKED